MGWSDRTLRFYRSSGNAILISLLLAFTSVPLSAQSVSSSDSLSIRGDRRQILPGLSWGELDMRFQGSGFRANEILINQTIMSGSPDLMISDRGYWQSGLIESVIPDDGPELAVNLLPVPGLLAISHDDHGFLFLDNRLWVWPPEHPLAVIGALGNLSIREPEGFSATLQLARGESASGEKGTEFPVQGISLSGLNVRPGTESGLYLMSGTHIQNPATSTWFSPDTEAVLMRPVSGNDDSHQSLWSASGFPDEPFFVTGNPDSWNRVIPGKDQYALLFHEADDGMDSEFESVRQLLGTETEFRLDFELPDELRLSKAAFELGPLVWSDGLLQKNMRSFDPFLESTFLIQDTDGTTFRFSEPEFSVGLDVDFREDALLEYFNSRGIDKVWMILRSKKSLWWEDAKDPSIGGRLNDLSFGVLTVVPAGNQMTIADYGQVELLPVLTASESGELNMGTPVDGLFDGLMKPDRALSTFWSTKAGSFPSEISMSRTSENQIQAWVEVRLEAPSTIAAIDFHHAENSSFSPDHNIKSMRIMGRRSPSDRWRILKTIEHDLPVRSERQLIGDDIPVEYVRLEVVEGSFLPVTAAIRLSEMTLWGIPLGDMTD